jgi:hypothetical protein
MKTVTISNRLSNTDWKVYIDGSWVMTGHDADGGQTVERIIDFMTNIEKELGFKLVVLDDDIEYSND